MPILPSGLKLALSRDALFDHGGNWFTCPDRHFWYWVADTEIMGSGPYELGSEVIRSAAHAPAPNNAEEAKEFIYVLECGDDEKWGWRGETLAEFPQYRTLSTEDQMAWNAWIESEEIQTYLEETVQICERLARDRCSATGMAVFTSREG